MTTVTPGGTTHAVASASTICHWLGYSFRDAALDNALRHPIGAAPDWGRLHSLSD